MIACAHPNFNVNNRPVISHVLARRFHPGAEYLSQRAFSATLGIGLDTFDADCIAFAFKFFSNLFRRHSLPLHQSYLYRFLH
jgi:hypothetical protein